MKTDRSLEQLWPMLIFLLIGVLIIGCLLYSSPSWGFMDDLQHLGRAAHIAQSDSILTGLKDVLAIDLKWGMFRPVYYVWIAFTYHFLKDSPLTIYILIAIFNIITLALWGYTLHSIFCRTNKDQWQHIFLFPLTFLIFTPFWNNFIYISVQQKFIITLSALSILFFFRAYKAKYKVNIFLSSLFLVLSIGIHPEGIFVAMAFIGCIVIDALGKRKIDRISLISLLTYLCLFIAYYIFTMSVQLAGDSYTSKYKSSLGIRQIFSSIATSPIGVKGILGLATIALITPCLKAFTRKETDLKAHTLLPLSIISFIVILSPWGFPNYHLSILAPLVMGIFFPTYVTLTNKSKTTKFIVNVLIVSMALAACFFIGSPRIAKMGQKKEIVHFLKKHHKENLQSIYLGSPPLYEATLALEHFSGANTFYLNEGTLSRQELMPDLTHYLVFSDESSPLLLDGVNVGAQIYASDTWRIFEIKAQEGYNGTFNVAFKKNLLQEIVAFLRR